METPTMILLIIEFLIFVIFMAIRHSEKIRKKIIVFLENFERKHSLVLEIKEPQISSTTFKILFGIMIVTFFLTSKMILIIFLASVAFLIPKTVISFENYEKIFQKRNPGLKKYNFYLMFVLLIEIILIVNVIIFIK